jgi:hypothetical protein
MFFDEENQFEPGPFNLVFVALRWTFTMKCVVDSNYLRDERLQTYLSASPHNIAILTDYAAMEALKGDALVGMYESMKILARYPSQVQILKTTLVACGLSGVGKGLQRRLVNVPLTSEFGLFCKNLAAAHSGSTPLASQLRSLGVEARAHLARVEADARGFADASVEVARLFSPQERHDIVHADRYTENLMRKLIFNVMHLSAVIFDRHPSVRRLPSSTELFNTYIFRSSLCVLLLAFDYALVGGVAGKSTARIRNDMVDSHFATYATFFDGLLSKDVRSNWLYRMTAIVLLRFQVTYSR